MNIFIPAILASLLVLTGCGDTKTATPATSSPTETTTGEATAKIHEISADSDKIYHEAAQSYGKGNHAESIRLADKALALDEKNYKALSLKGIILAFDVSPEEGIASIQKSLAINPDYVQASYDMAIAQKLGRHYDESITYFQKVLKADPQNTWSYYGIATNYADKKDREQALAYLEKAVLTGGNDVISAASTQDHFSWLRDDPDFQRILQIK